MGRIGCAGELTACSSGNNTERTIITATWNEPRGRRLFVLADAGSSFSLKEPIHGKQYSPGRCRSGHSSTAADAGSFVCRGRAGQRRNEHEDPNQAYSRDLSGERVLRPLFWDLSTRV